jgi:hypothetical protein
VPWCAECARQVASDELVAPREQRAGEAASESAAEPAPALRDRCPSCGAVLKTEAPSEEELVHAKAPWHFKVLVVGSVVYLGYRLYQGIGWLIHHA